MKKIVFATVFSFMAIFSQALLALPSNGINSKSKLWPSGVVYFGMDSNVSAELEANIFRAIRMWAKYTHLSFVRIDTGSWQEMGKAHILFHDHGTKGFASSSVGFQGDIQKVNLETHSWTPLIVHEIGHAIGLHHEHQRYDRYDHLNFYINHVRPDKRHNFSKRGRKLGPYDYFSIMQYDSNDFCQTISGKKLLSMTKIDNAEFIKNSNKISLGDAYGVYSLYGKESEFYLKYPQASLYEMNTLARFEEFYSPDHYMKSDEDQFFFHQYRQEYQVWQDGQVQETILPSGYRFLKIGNKLFLEGKIIGEFISEGQIYINYHAVKYSNEPTMSNWAKRLRALYIKNGYVILNISYNNSSFRIFHDKKPEDDLVFLRQFKR